MRRRIPFPFSMQQSSRAALWARMVSPPYASLALLTTLRSNTASASPRTPAAATAPIATILGSSEAKNSLEEKIAQFVPLRFTTIAQIARSVPGDLMETLQEQEDCGLMQFLMRRPKLFEVTRVAGVLRAKLRHGQRPVVDGPVRESSAPPVPLPIHSKRTRVFKKAPEHVLQRYPRFCIPFVALLQCTGEPAEKVWAQLHEDAEYLHFTRLYETSDSLEVQQARTFVSLLPECQLGCATEADNQYSVYEVESYEWFRIARVSPYTRTYLVLTPSVIKDAIQLLPPGRDPLHVWASSPELFEIGIGDGENGELGMLCVRFVLHPSYMASGGNKSEEEITRMIEELGGQTQRLKKKRRRLRRALQCVREPLSFLDERVWAHYIFDSLPASGSATAEKVISMMPEAYKNCTPVQWRTTLQKFPTLFKVYDGPVELVIQRADLPEMQMRPLKDITPEEILQEIYKGYPLRFHPELGVTISQMLTKLPKSISQRLYSLKDVEKEVLLRFPEKVEILRGNTFFSQLPGDPPVYSTSGLLQVPYKNRSDMLLQVRGREDFLLGFRFIGEWQERLLEKFGKRCQKYDCDPKTTSSLPLPV